MKSSGDRFSIKEYASADLSGVVPRLGLLIDMRKDFFNRYGLYGDMVMRSKSKLPEVAIYSSTTFISDVVFRSKNTLPTHTQATNDPSPRIVLL